MSIRSWASEPGRVAALRLISRLACLGCILGITVLAFMPSSTAVGLPGDKVNHLLAFFTLALLARLGWPQAPAWHDWSALLAYGVLIELVQALLPTRSFSLLDVAADLVGIAGFEVIRYAALGWGRLRRCG